MGLIVIEPLEPFPGFLREHRDTGQALISRGLTAHVHSAAIIPSLHDLCVTKVSELEQSHARQGPATMQNVAASLFPGSLSL